MDFDAKFDARTPGTEPDEETVRQVLRDFALDDLGDIVSISPLSGGYSNINMLVTRSRQPPLTLRLSDNPPDQLETELSILNALHGSIPVPKVHDRILDHPAINRHVALLEHLPGQPLSQIEDHLPDSAIASIGGQLGTILARVHRLSFDHSGFLDKDFKVGKPFPSFYEGYYGYLRKCLKSPLLAQRLAPDDLHKLKELVEANADRVRRLTETNRLVHSDFNQKNILVDCYNDNWVVTGILDWEFAFSGCPLEDFGNFFRYRDEISPAYKDAFVQAYRAQGGALDADWEPVSRILDLLSMVDFLTREDDSPRTFATARAIIQATIRDLMDT